MKTLFFSIALVGGTFWAQGQQLALQTAPEGTPSPKWDKTVINLGKVKRNQPATATFSFTNTGGGALVITEVKPSCSCTVPQYTKEPVGAGKKGTVKAEYDAKNVGSFHKTITVYSNAESGAETLTFQGEVVE